MHLIRRMAKSDGPVYVSVTTADGQIKKVFCVYKYTVLPSG